MDSCEFTAFHFLPPVCDLQVTSAYCRSGMCTRRGSAWSLRDSNGTTRTRLSSSRSPPSNRGCILDTNPAARHSIIVSSFNRENEMKNENKIDEDNKLEMKSEK